MDTITLNGQTVEAGGTFLLNTNRYMVEFATETGINRRNLLREYFDFNKFSQK